MTKKKPVAETRPTVPANTPNGQGRPTLKTDELLAELLSRIAAGESVNRITKDAHMPERVQIYRWLREDETFRINYTQAKSDSADKYAEEVLDLADELANLERKGENRLSHEDIALAKLRVDSRKWAAGKLKPKTYGDKILHGVGGVEALVDLPDNNSNY